MNDIDRLDEADEPRVFIGIPYYRGLRYLEEAIQSVVRQHSRHWELVVADDSGGDDGAEELVRGLNDERIQYVRNQRNIGMVGNWNKLLDLAPPDALVTLLHADDRLLPNYVDQMTALVDEFPDAVACFCTARIIDRHGRPSFSMPDFVKSFYRPRGRTIRLHGERGLTALVRGNFIFCPTLCFRKTRLGERRFSKDWKQVQDLELTARLLIEGESLVGCEESAYEYRRHPESATTQQSENFLRFREESRCLDQIAYRSQLLGWNRTAHAARGKTILKLHLTFRLLKCIGSLRFQLAVDHLRLLSRISRECPI